MKVVGSGVVSVAAGYNHSLFVKSDGSLWAMGYNNNGQLGNGNTTQQPTPVKVVDGGVQAVAGGENTSWFVAQDGALWRMGSGAGNVPSRYFGPPRITTQPGSRTLAPGNGLVFSVVADGGGLSYQWHKDGTAIGSATSASYTISSASIASAGVYTVAVRNSFGTVTSNGAVLTITAAPVITTQPANQVITQGASGTLSVAAMGSGLTYQWRKGGANIAGATSASYTITNAQSTHDGTYSCVVSNAYGDTPSNTASVTVTIVPVINTQPVTQSVTAGNNVTFSVAVSGMMRLV